METRDLVIKTSLDMFTNKGVRGTTVDEIASKLMMSKRTLYEMFSDKKTLVKECLIVWVENARSQFEGLTKKDENVFLRLISVADLQLSILRNTNSDFLDTLKIAQDHAPAESTEKSKQQYELYFEKLLIEGIAEGLIETNFDPKILVWQLGSQLSALRNVSSELQRNFFTVYKTIWYTFLNGISTEKGRSVLSDMKNRSDFREWNSI